MEAPLLLALARARLPAGGGTAGPIQAVWASQRALGLLWGPDRAAGLAPGMAWVFLLTPSPELWMLPEKAPAYPLLRAEAKTAQSRLWSGELKGARLHGVLGDPGERWIGLVFHRRSVTGKEECTLLSFQAIPGRGGLRLDVHPWDGTGPNKVRIGLGTPFPPGQPEPAGDTPPLRKWRERWGDDLEAALQGLVADILPGEGPLLKRHAEWSLGRAETLLLNPSVQAEGRRMAKEMERLRRYGEALGSDRERHRSMLALRGQAMMLLSEMWRLKGAKGNVELQDGTRIELPPGLRAEDAAKKWFNAAKKADRGLAHVGALERDLHKRLLEFEASTGDPPGGASPSAPPALGNKPGGKEMAKAETDKTEKRADGKGRGFRSLMVDGLEVLVGKGDAENDSLTFNVASPHDFWLHVAGLGGSHVVIRNPDRLGEPPRSVLERAAGLAAYYSKARHGGKVEVHWCRVADVGKPRGFAPGKVLLRKHKSLMVYPRE